MDTESVGKIVPEIYYDFIARLMPGVALVICIDPLRNLLFSWSDKIGQTGLFCMVIGVGYLTGLLLSALALPVNLIIGFIFCPRLLCWLAGVKLDLPLSPLRAHAKIYRDIDILKRTDAVAGAVLTKMEATAALSDHLLCAAIALMIASRLGLGASLISGEWLRILLPCLLVVVILRRGTLLARLVGFLEVGGNKNKKQ